MQLEWTKEAIEQLRTRALSTSMYLKYETEGCGCVMSGVTALYPVHEQPEGTTELNTNDISVFLDTTKLVFFEERMTIDYKKEYNTFQLKSPNGMLNPRLRLVLTK
ncbi:HesB/YadR/YfhF-family protein [Fictibacillus macauensis ZFHKF-1]|uniref:HesB/YadR/YfhF-family protein n=1 Tax=Fictibacillus macauensis ZFHKF-1 TaxID=1196324 RepID=I8J652_9BACL|nr:iron-sulfur cluster biosynthesis family protein [Fictibacillus macauensis]EIT87286.1 HesB/YadR/YfhF-family protein [Fictibacillus macauensis ZFHKF-1]